MTLKGYTVNCMRVVEYSISAISSKVRLKSCLPDEIKVIHTLCKSFGPGVQTSAEVSSDCISQGGISCMCSRNDGHNTSIKQFNGVAS